MRACKLSALIMWDLHLRKKKTGTAEFFLFVPDSWAAAIESPIPERENQHVGQPEQRARAQEFEGRFSVRWKCSDQQSHRRDQRERCNSIKDEPKGAIE